MTTTRTATRLTASQRIALRWIDAAASGRKDEAHALRAANPNATLYNTVAALQRKGLVQSGAANFTGQTLTDAGRAAL